VSSSRSAANGTPYASRRARTSTSTTGPTASRGSSSARRISRRRRLRRFRSTTRCRCFGTMRPTRGCARGEAESKTSRWAVLLRFPRFKTDRMSSRRVSLRERGSRFRPSPPPAGILAGATSCRWPRRAACDPCDADG
jgi:hypothetical protein